MKTIRNLIILVGIMAVTSSAYAYGAHKAPPQAHRATYALQTDLWGYPYSLKLRHCAPAEDALGTLKMVDYRPADGVVVYRCAKV